MNDESKGLPADVTQVIFHALNLSMQEKKEVLYLLEDDRGVTIAAMQDYIANRFKKYEMITSSLGSFKIETLSPSASKPEVVHGIEAAFQAAIPDGKVIQLSLLQHMGLQTSNMKLKPKLLTCSSAFSNKYDLNRKG